MCVYKGWVFDNVVFVNDVIKMMKEDVLLLLVEGVYVYGLFLDGVGWDWRNCRFMEFLFKVLFIVFLVVYIFVVNIVVVVKDLKDNKDVFKFYECFVYKKFRCIDLIYIFCLNFKIL